MSPVAKKKPAPKKAPARREISTSPSQAELREQCPGSGALAAVTPKEAQSEEASKGDKIHAAIQAALSRTAAETETTAERALAAAQLHGLTEPYDLDTVDIGLKMLERRIKELLAAEGFPDGAWPGVRTEVEAPLLASGHHGRARIDVLLTFSEELVMVVEIKTGALEVTGPSGNRQLHDYMVGAKALLPGGRRFIGAILQPGMVPEFWWRDGAWSSDQVDQLAEQLKGIRTAALQPNAPLQVGLHCSYCPAAQMCPARRGTVTAAVAVYQEHGTSVAEYFGKLTVTERGAVYKQAKQAQSYLAKFDELVKAYALNTGDEIAGYTRAAGKGSRRFYSEKGNRAAAEQIFQTVGPELIKAGLIKSEDDLVEPISPAKVEEALDDVTAAKLGTLIRKEAGALTLIAERQPKTPRPRKA